MLKQKCYNKKNNKNNKQKKKKMQNIIDNTNNNEDLNKTIFESPTKTMPTNTPAQKRLREVMQNSLLGNACKTPRLINTESPLKFITIMDKRFDKLTEQLQSIIETKFNECKDNLLSEIDKRFNTIKCGLDELNKRVTHLESVAVEFKTMQDEIKSLKTKMKRQENNTVACDLRLNEIPFSENENLMDIFSDICNAIQVSVPAVKSIYRLQNQNNKNKTDSKDAVIIVKMWSPYDKNYFLKSFASFKKLNKGFFFCLRHIGINSDNKFYVNENLTATNFNILRAAVRMKKRKYIHSAFTMRGLVYIKKTANDNLTLIDDINCLNELFPDSANHQFPVDDRQYPSYQL